MDTLCWGEAHGAKCTYLKIPFFYSKGYVSLDTAKSLQTAPTIVTSGITNRQYLISTWLVFKRSTKYYGTKGVRKKKERKKATEN